MTLLDTQTGGVTTPATVGIPSATSTTSAPVTPLDVKTTPAPAPANTNAVKSSVNQGGVTPSGLVIKADGSTIDYAASATNLQNKQADLSKQASALGGQNTTTIAPTNTTTAPTVVSSSAPVVANEQKTTADVSGLNADNATTTQGHNDYLAQLDAQGQALEARRLAETESINKQFDASKASTVDAQNRETGTFSSTLARIGGIYQWILQMQVGRMLRGGIRHRDFPNSNGAVVAARGEQRPVIRKIDAPAAAVPPPHDLTGGDVVK